MINTILLMLLVFVIGCVLGFITGAYFGSRAAYRAMTAYFRKVRDDRSMNKNPTKSEKAIPTPENIGSNVVKMKGCCKVDKNKLH